MITVTPDEYRALLALEVDAEKLADVALADQLEQAPSWVRALAIDAINLGARNVFAQVKLQMQVKPP